MFWTNIVSSIKHFLLFFFRFLKKNGLSLNVRVLNDRGEHFDETNAASALLTNACFKREDIKAAYGDPAVGAPAALAYVSDNMLFQYALEVI